MGGRNFKKYGVRQHDLTDCGAACLASIGLFYKIRIPIARIRQYAHTSIKGTNMMGMIHAAEKMGFDANGVRYTSDDLSLVPTPCIAHLKLNEKFFHFVVLFQSDKTGVTFMDPGDGEIHSLNNIRFKKLWTGILLLLTPSNNFLEVNDGESKLKRFWTLIAPHKSVLTEVLVGAALYTILGLSTALFVQILVDKIISTGNSQLLVLIGIVMIGLLIIQTFLGVFRNYLLLLTGHKIDARLIISYLRHLFRLPVDFFSKMRTGEIISRVSDAIKIRVFVNDILINIAISLITLILSITLMFTYYWKLGLVMTLIIPIYYLIFWITNVINKKAQRKVMESSAKFESFLVESITNIRTIKQFGIESYIDIKSELRFNDLLGKIYKSGINSIFTTNSTAFVTRLFTILILWLGSVYVFEREITLGELLSFYALISYFTSPINQLINSNRSYQDASIAGDRLFEILELESDVAKKTKLKTDFSFNEVVFNNIGFRYGTNERIFDKLNLSLKAGEITSLVGKSGCGKTTVSKIIQRLYPYEEGSIHLGDYNLDHISQNELSNFIGTVPQSIELFSGNILENIVLGEFEPDIKKVSQLITKYRIGDIFQKLEKGLLTDVGKDGKALSGGQKQIVGLIRVLYRNPKFYILDEPTSALDTETEKCILQILRQLKSSNKIILLISHRLSTIRIADKIYHLFNGSVKKLAKNNDLIDQKNKTQDILTGQYNKINNETQGISGD